MADIPTGFIILGSSTVGILIGLFALAYEMVRTSDDVKKVIDALKKEVHVLEIKVRKPDLVNINRLIKISYKILRSPMHKEESRAHLAELVKEMLEVKKHMSAMDWLHAEKSDMRSLIQLHHDSVDRLKGIIQYYKHH